MPVTLRPAGRRRRGAGRARARYKWVALSNTTLGALLASINASIMLIALPDVFRGIGVNPLQPGNGSLLLCLIMGDRARGTRDRRGAGGIPAPVSVLFASLLGYNPVRTLLGLVLAHLHPAQAAFLTGRGGFFPTLISPPFAQGLSAAFGFAAVACLIAALAWLLRGGRYVYGESAGLAGPPPRGHCGWRGLACVPALAIAGFTRIAR
jgi:hypothetical protein